MRKLLLAMAITGLCGCTDTGADGSGRSPLDPGVDDGGSPVDPGGDAGYPSRACESAADCPTGTACVAGRCEEQACSIPSDCPVGYACLEGVCRTAGESPAPGFDPRRTEPFNGEGPNRIVGIVTDLEGAPLPGARVTVDAEPVTASTDEDGAYELDDVPPGSRVVHVTASGYLGYSRRVEVAPWETVFVNVRLMQRAAEVVIDPSVGAVVGDEEGSATIPASALVGPDGVPIGEPVRVSLTAIDPTGAELEGAPGDYVAAEEGGDPMTPLVSYGMVDLTVTDGEGEPIDLAEGEEIEIVLPAPEGVELGDVIPTWTWDREIPAWVRQDIATVEERDGALVLVGNVNQTNITWNCDDPEVEVCYTGQALDCAGFPLRGAEVQLIGGGVTSLTTDRTDEEGRYTVRGTARGGAIVRARIRIGNSEYVVDSDIVPVSSGCAPVEPHVFSEIRYTGGRIELGSQELWTGTGDPSTVPIGSAVFYDPFDPAAEGFQMCDEGDSDILRVATRQGVGDERLEVLDVGNPILVEGETVRLDLVRTYEESEYGELDLSTYFILPGSQLEGGGEPLSVDIPGVGGILPQTALPDALSLPESLVVTSPSADAPREVQASEGLSLRWVPSSSGTQLGITMTSLAGTVALLGNLEDDGAFNVTPEQLEQFRGQTVQVSMRRVHERFERLPTGPAVALRGFSSVGFNVEVR